MSYQISKKFSGIVSAAAYRYLVPVLANEYTVSPTRIAAIWVSPPFTARRGLAPIVSADSSHFILNTLHKGTPYEICFSAMIIPYAAPMASSSFWERGRSF
jgi:hypothetical protein